MRKGVEKLAFGEKSELWRLEKNKTEVIIHSRSPLDNLPGLPVIECRNQTFLEYEISNTV